VHSVLCIQLNYAHVDGGARRWKWRCRTGWCPWVCRPVGPQVSSGTNGAHRKRIPSQRGVQVLHPHRVSDRAEWLCEARVEATGGGGRGPSEEGYCLSARSVAPGWRAGELETSKMGCRQERHCSSDTAVRSPGASGNVLAIIINPGHNLWRLTCCL
jgi:hypothetical protein